MKTLVTTLWRRGWVRNAIGSSLILAAVGLALWFGALRPIDDLFNGWRFDNVRSEASKGLVIVEIDSRSLSRAETWPWERERYAEAIDRLLGAGATLVAIDVDFSAASDAESDAALAGMISRYPGQVTLGSFRQMDSYGAGESRVVQNLPIPMLMRDALIASVNVPVDEDGEVRRYGYRSSMGQRASLAANLAGVTREGEFAIDFGIDRRTLPHLSFDDVLNDRFDPRSVEGRVILIGATALELGDEFATPVGLLPGVVIHGLAYESIVAGRTLMTLHPGAILILCLGLGLLLLPRRDGRRLRDLMVRHVIVGGGIVAIPLVLQQATPVSIDIAALLGTQVLFGVWAARSELMRRGREIVAEREAGLRRLALHHAETQLPNRRALIEWIEAGPQTGQVVFAVGIERYAEMRGVVGYNVTNLVMRELAARLSSLGEPAQVAHISSSVLAFARTDLSPDAFDALLNRLRRLETNFQIEGHSVDVFLRTGIATADAVGTSPTELVERATRALDRAGGAVDRVCVYDEATFASADNNLALMTEMIDALGRNEISLHYQPKMQTADGQVTSVEALCRWHHPIRGFVPPDLFIPIAEQTGQIRALTEWSILRAIQDQIRLRASGHDVTIALNISGRLLADDAFKDKVIQFASAVDADLCLEITETAVIDNPDKARSAIAAFRAVGLKISIDDYGSGLSSLAYLKLLNADELKIDRSLVTELADSQRDRLIMKSTIDLAHSLGMSVVAEGVETEAIVACLSLLGCDVIQGYWLSRPLPLVALATFLDEHAATSLDTPLRQAS
ncbi:MAG: hypothetical protein B7Z42_00215 [Brevundimonas sp. 12-68-7]|uniref:EAL domain-containing protein n=1 Tax=Brevundimonas subvibrioides TaxID=74313 RepID=A0A258FDW8_9CAUL|nr:MAG: hypothetical protein B7Z42_00215 [Brevundimonas sp. 12-68-7]OYX30174.1 MAG: hypothetical protein B7Z01_14900 [Brevundimonas subvibrioides]